MSFEENDEFYDVKSRMHVRLKEKLTNYDSGYNYWIADACFRDGNGQTESLWNYIIVNEDNLLLY